MINAPNRLVNHSKKNKCVVWYNGGLLMCVCFEHMNKAIYKCQAGGGYLCFPCQLKIKDEIKT